jgi:hypothetical protein
MARRRAPIFKRGNVWYTRVDGRPVSLRTADRAEALELARQQKSFAKKGQSSTGERRPPAEENRPLSSSASSGPTAGAGESELPDPLEQVGNDSPIASNENGDPIHPEIVGEASGDDLSDEQVEAVATHLAELGAGILCATTAIAVRYMGRQPGMPSEARTTALVDALKIKTREWVRAYKLSPWTVIAAACVGVGIEQYQNGEPVPAGQPKRQESAPQAA